MALPTLELWSQELQSSYKTALFGSAHLKTAKLHIIQWNSLISVGGWEQPVTDDEISQISNDPNHFLNKYHGKKKRCNMPDALDMLVAHYDTFNQFSEALEILSSFLECLTLYLSEWDRKSVSEKASKAYKVVFVRDLKNYVVDSLEKSCETKKDMTSQRLHAITINNRCLEPLRELEKRINPPRRQPGAPLRIDVNL